MLALLLAARACLPVDGERITIGDLAAAIPAFLQIDQKHLNQKDLNQKELNQKELNQKEPIGFAPAPGATRRFSPADLNRLAARKGIAIHPEPVCFEREMETLSRDRVIAALRESLPAGAQMELIDFSQGRIPKGTLEFPRGGLTRARTASPREAVIWRGRVTYAARQSVPVWAKTRAWLPRASIVAAQDLPVGKPIGAGQIRIDIVDDTPFSTNPALSPGEVAGLTPRRRILAGQAIARSALELPAEIARGERVGVEAHYGAAFLRFEARAELAGRIGDSIPVRNLESGKTFRARVLRKGVVTVE